MSKIVVVGSSNTDMVIKAARLPAPGETVLGGDFFMNPGGKGANQAVAAARLGGEVCFVAKVGADIFGQQAVEGFRNEGIDTTFVAVDAERPSGVATISVDAQGENCIAVASGANDALSPADVDNARERIESAEVLLMQLETPLPTVQHAAVLAKQSGKRVILNPAPAQPLADELLALLDVITPNETEAEILTGIKVESIDDAERAARALQQKGLASVIITLGARGAFVLDGSFTGLVAAPKVDPVDTTAAGDTFNGALAVALAEGQTIEAAVAFANKAAAISVTRLGAQASTPTLQELQNAP